MRESWKKKTHGGEEEKKMVRVFEKTLEQDFG